MIDPALTHDAGAQIASPRPSHWLSLPLSAEQLRDAQVLWAFWNLFGLAVAVLLGVESPGAFELCILGFLPLLALWLSRGWPYRASGLTRYLYAAIGWFVACALVLQLTASEWVWEVRLGVALFPLLVSVGLLPALYLGDITGARPCWPRWCDTRAWRSRPLPIHLLPGPEPVMDVSDGLAEELRDAYALFGLSPTARVDAILRRYGELLDEWARIGSGDAQAALGRKMVLARACDCLMKQARRRYGDNGGVEPDGWVLWEAAVQSGQAYDRVHALRILYHQAPECLGTVLESHPGLVFEAVQAEEATALALWFPGVCLPFWEEGNLRRLQMTGEAVHLDYANRARQRGRRITGLLGGGLVGAYFYRWGFLGGPVLLQISNDFSASGFLAIATVAGAIVGSGLLGYARRPMGVSPDEEAPAPGDCHPAGIVGIDV